jgi:hypothetical protein
MTSASLSKALLYRAKGRPRHGSKQQSKLHNPRGDHDKPGIRALP